MNIETLFRCFEDFGDSEYITIDDSQYRWRMASFKLHDIAVVIETNGDYHFRVKNGDGRVIEKTSYDSKDECIQTASEYIIQNVFDAPDGI